MAASHCLKTSGKDLSRAQACLCPHGCLDLHLLRDHLAPRGCCLSLTPWLSTCHSDPQSKGCRHHGSELAGRKALY